MVLLTTEGWATLHVLLVSASNVQMCYHHVEYCKAEFYEVTGGVGGQTVKQMFIGK